MQYAWDASDGSYTDATQWTPEGVPLWDNGVTALIQSATVTLNNVEPNAVSITLAGLSAETQPNLVLDNAALGPSVRISLVPPSEAGQPTVRSFAAITVEGSDTSQGSIGVGAFQTSPDVLTIATAPYGKLNQERTISVSFGLELRVGGTDGAPATPNNDATINVVGGSAAVSADVTGSGTIAFIENRTILTSVEFGGGVSSTQHVLFRPISADLRIDDPSAFHGIIDGFTGLFDRITLANTQATGAYFAQVTPDAGMLLPHDGQ